LGLPITIKLSIFGAFQKGRTLTDFIFIAKLGGVMDDAISSLTEKFRVVMNKMASFSRNDSIFVVYSLSVSSFISDIIPIEQKLF